MDMDMDNAELKDLKELKAIKEAYGWTDETRDYKVRLKAIQKKYSQLAKAESKPKGGKAKAAAGSSKLGAPSARGYDYLLGMPLWSLTLERVETLKAELASKESELRMSADNGKIFDKAAMELAESENEVTYWDERAGEDENYLGDGAFRVEQVRGRRRE